MNDFREYAAAFQDHQNDLAHYGVKGMKWKHHKRSLKEYLYGGDSEAKRQDAQGRVMANDRSIWNRAYGNNDYNPDKDPHRVRLRNGHWSFKDVSDQKKFEEAVKQDSERHSDKNYREKLDANYRKADAKAKIAYNNSVAGKAKRNLNALKDTVKSASFDDYKKFFKPKKKKK